jgi:hypothetical protein
MIVLLLILYGSTSEQAFGNETKKKYETELNNTKSTFEKYFPYVKDSLSVLALFLGIILTYPLLRKKLVENHITNTLQSIQDSNRKVQIECQKLIDKYTPLTYSNYPLRKSNIDSLYNEIRNLYYESQKSSSDIATILFYFKNTLQGVLKHYDHGRNPIISSDLSNFTISILYTLTAYSSKVIQIPRSTKMVQKKIVSKSIRKFVSNSNRNQYKYFSQGVIHDPRTSHLIVFFDRIKQTKNSLIKRSAFKIYNSYNHILNTLFLYRIYVPPILEYKNGSSLNLFLIDFKYRIPSEDEVVELTYTNLNDSDRFIDSLDLKKIKYQFEDAYIKDSKFKLNPIKVTKTCIETITIEVKEHYLELKFNSLKKAIKTKMKSEFNKYEMLD